MRDMYKCTFENCKNPTNFALIGFPCNLSSKFFL